MRISGIEVYQADLAYAGGEYRLSGGRSYRSFDATFARVIAEDGTEGWGESTPFGATYIAAHGPGARAGIAEIAPALLGLDPRHHDRVRDAMDAALVGHNHAKAALDTACWDLHGKLTGQAVCDLLGGRIAGAVPLISSIPVDTPEAMRAHVAEMRAQGFRGHSVKIGAAEAEGGPSLDAARLTACLADRQPGEWFLADANGGMSVEHALRLQSLLPDGLDFVLEAPCATWAETMSLRKLWAGPILLDELILTESDLIHAIRLGACDGFGLKISKQGGLTSSARQRTIASAAGMVMSVQETVGSEVAFAAILHMAQSTPRHLLRCALDTRSMVSTRIAGFDAPVRNGGAEAPDTPGLGVTVDIAALGEPVMEFRA